MNGDQKYAMGMAIRNIGDNYKSVSLLKVAIEYVESNPVQMSHKQIDLNALA
jgi:hypothetical protein